MRIKNEKELLEKLKEDVKETDKERIIILAGHFPLVYLKKGAIEAIDKWGEFSRYSLEMGCEVGKYAREIGKEVKFVFFVDDHAYESVAEIAASSRARRRRRLYGGMSGPNAKLPETYGKIMGQYGFDEKDVLRHDHGKPTRKDCLYFSEKILRKSIREILNECAKEYAEFIEDKKYFNKDKDYMLTFGPNRCKSHICDIALDIEIKGLSASHVFMETMAPLSKREELYSFGRGVSYRKDN
jgi:hypothetical protein